jgi:negative regulator of flagellin synthesis FlgM
MKIQPSIGELKPTQEGAKANERPAGQAAAKPAPGGDSARVDLSKLSAQIAALESSLAAVPFDAARVESIRQAIVEGRVTVNADRVADRMVASALALLGRRDGSDAAPQ